MIRAPRRGRPPAPSSWPPSLSSWRPERARGREHDRAADRGAAPRLRLRHGRAPGAVTIVASGFPPGGLVYVEQCDGVAPTRRNGLRPHTATSARRRRRRLPTAAGRDLRLDRQEPRVPSVRRRESAVALQLPGAGAGRAGERPAELHELFIARLDEQHHGPPIKPSWRWRSKRVGVDHDARGECRRRLDEGSRRRPARRSRRSKEARRRRRNLRPRRRSTDPQQNVVAVVAAPSSSHDVGVWSLSDSNLASGYILVLVGLLIVGMAIALRRRDRATPAGVRDAEPR